MFHRKTPRRSELQVIADLLEASVDPESPTKILKMANAPPRGYKSLLEALVSKGLLRKVKSPQGNRSLYQTTQEGNDILQLIHRLRDALGELW